MLGPVFTRCHISGTVPARQCSTLLYMFLRPSLSQSQSADCCNAVSCSDAWRSGDVSRVTTGMGHTAKAILTTGHEVMIMIPKYALLSGYLRHFLVSLTISNINIIRTWQSSEQCSTVQCGVWPGPGCSAGPLNGMCESNVDWEESWNFVTLQISIPRILDGYQCRCHQHSATMHHQSPHLTLKYWAFQSHTARDDEMKTSGAKVSLFQILFPADHLIIITNYRLPWKWNWMSLAHNNTLLGI